MVRLISFFASTLLLCLFMIPMILISLLILTLDKENPIYFSERIGKNNVNFRMPKFRTMRSDTPQKATHSLEDPEQYLLSMGRFLRKYSLDEIPQLFSILKGDMAFVGPRPALFNQYDLIELREEKGVSALKPGITGWAQVNGRDDLSTKKKVEFDVQYLEKISVLFDLYILWLTIIKVLRKDGVSH